MAFIKVVKNKAYYKRYQVKYRRRRAGKTDYRARLRLTVQDKNKYNSPKYRFVVRISGSDVVCQVAYATIAGDKVIASAYSHELPNYGLKVGLTNYAACYCVGLLCARRLLNSMKNNGKTMAELFPGNTEDVGEDFNVEELDDDEAPRPFTALLDVGLARTSTGSRVFAALKGGVDGGISIPHNDKRFAGSSADGGDAETLRHYIMGGHVSDYMEHLQEDDDAKYQTQFSTYIKNKVAGDSLEDLYESVHEAIRKNPDHTKKARKAPAKKTIWKAKKHSYETRKANLKAKLEALTA